MIGMDGAARATMAEMSEITAPEIMNHLRPKMSLKPPARGSEMVVVMVFAVRIQL